MATQVLRITPVYDLLLRGSPAMPVGLYHLQIATAAQLCRLHYSAGSIKAVKARLKNLVDAGYIQADGIPTKLFRSPYYYTLGQKAVRYLEETGMHVNDSFRADRETNKHALFIDHTLELNDIVVSAALIKRDDPRYTLAEFIHERTLKHHPYKASWKENGHQQEYTIIPDAFLDFHIQQDYERRRRVPIVLEHDRSTEGKYYFKRRIRAYIVLIKSGEYQQLFGVKSLTVAFTTFSGKQRLAQMLEWTRQELESNGESKQLGSLFCFTEATQPVDSRKLWLERQWHTPYSKDAPFSLLAG